MFPAAEAAAFVVEPGVAARQGDPAAGLPPFFMGSMWPAAGAGGGAGAAGSEEDDEAAVAMAEAALHERAVAATRNHREAEKRRRERIKSHLDRLRAVLACDPKIDKASLLAKAVERVRDLKQRMAGIGAEAAVTPQLFPTEHDEIVVLASSGGVFEASVCCDDRSDLLPGLIDTLRALRLRTLRAEMATLGGRVRNVLVLARDAGAEDDDGGGDFLKEALRALVERHGAAGGGGGDRPKRRRTVSDMNMQAAA